MKFKVNEIDICQVLDEDLFDKIGETHENEDDLLKMPNEVTMDNRIASSLYEGNSFFGNSYMDLYQEEDGYYIKRCWKEPIGDYASHWLSEWFKCNNNVAVEKALSAIKK